MQLENHTCSSRSEGCLSLTNRSWSAGSEGGEHALASWRSKVSVWLSWWDVCGPGEVGRDVNPKELKGLYSLYLLPVHVKGKEFCVFGFTEIYNQFLGFWGFQIIIRTPFSLMLNLLSVGWLAATCYQSYYCRVAQAPSVKTEYKLATHNNAWCHKKDFNTPLTVFSECTAWWLPAKLVCSSQHK